MSHYIGGGFDFEGNQIGDGSIGSPAPLPFAPGSGFFPEASDYDAAEFPISGETLVGLSSGNTPEDAGQAFSIGSALVEGFGTISTQAEADKAAILNSPTANAFRDELLRTSAPGYEALTREMLAAESQAIGRAAIGTGQQAAASLRRSGITDSGLAGAFKTLGAVRGAGDRAILEGNRLGINETLRGIARGQLGDLVFWEGNIMKSFSNASLNRLGDLVTSLVSTPGELAQATKDNNFVQQQLDFEQEQLDFAKQQWTDQLDELDRNGAQSAWDAFMAVFSQGGSIQEAATAAFGTAVFGVLGRQI